MPNQLSPKQAPATGLPEAAGVCRIALVGNPNTGKTTLFNRLSGLRHKTSNFPGTTQEARIGWVREARDGTAGASACCESADPGPVPNAGHSCQLIDLPGVYSLELDMNEAEVCRGVLAGTLAPPGSPVAAPDAVCVVIDATNLARNLRLVGEVLRRRLPTVVALNMIDLARGRGLRVEVGALERELGCPVVACSARKGEGLEELRHGLMRARIPNVTPPGTLEGLEAWAEAVNVAACSITAAGDGRARRGREHLTDALDRAVTHPVWGLAIFALVMGAVFWAIFSLATVPMDILDGLFAGNASWAAAWQPSWLRGLLEGGLAGAVRSVLPAGLVADFLADGIVSGIGATVVFLPQICLLFFLITLLEDTGYLARAAFVMDRALRPFGLPGHSFVPLLSSPACALPGIMACRAIPDRRQRLATILVAPFMTCSARLPVYVLLTGVLFPHRPLAAAAAFVGCYALGIGAGVLSAVIARRTILRGQSPPMALELPTYKRPSLRNAAATTIERGLMFLRKAGTNILAICVVLWWLGSFPHVQPPAAAEELRAQAAAQTDPALAHEITAEAARLTASDQKARSYVGRLGHTLQPAFEPLGYDWKLTVGVLTSFAAREVFVSTMAVVTAGTSDPDEEGVLDTIASSSRDDGRPIFTPAVAWSVLVFFVLAMQCLPTLAVTAKEAGHWKWAALQLGWMSAVAYGAAFIAYRVMGGA